MAKSEFFRFVLGLERKATLEDLKRFEEEEEMRLRLNESDEEYYYPTEE